MPSRVRLVDLGSTAGVKGLRIGQSLNTCFIPQPLGATGVGVGVTFS